MRQRAVGASIGLVALVSALRGHPTVAFICSLIVFGVVRRRQSVVPVGLVVGTVMVADAISSRSIAMATIGAVTATAVLAARPPLVGRPDARRQCQAFTTLAVTATVGFFIGVGSIYGDGAAWRPTPTVSTGVREIAHLVLGVAGPVAPAAALEPTSTAARSTAAGVVGLTTIGLLLAAALLLLPDGAAPTEADCGDENDASTIFGLVARSGRDSLAPFAARTDKDHVFTNDRRAAVAYRVVLGAALGGSPVGSPDRRQDALFAFLQLCARHGWLPAFIGADARTAMLARRHGFRAVKIGDEAVVDVATFALDTPRARNVRQAVQRTYNSGVAVTMTDEAGLTAVERDQLRTVAEGSHKGPPGRGFSMILDGFLEGAYPGALVAFCLDGDGRIVALQRYLPYGQGRGLTLDSMYRLPTAPNGVNERMIVEAISWARRHGCSEVSLNFAAFRSLYDRPPSLKRTLEHWLVHRLDPLVSVESLYRFNAKFAPMWRPRYVVFPTFASIASVLPAALVAEFGPPPKGAVRRHEPQGAPSLQPGATT